MRLQIALDTVNPEEAKELISRLGRWVDIVEIGTPMLLRYGMEPVKAIHAAFPELTVLADTKIMDAGEYEAAIAYEAGAEIATVMGVANNETIQGCVAAGKKAGKQVMADMMCVLDLETRARELVNLGVDTICVHTAVDIQSRHNPYEELTVIHRAVGNSRCAIAGGLCRETLENVIPYAPAIVIVGGGITGANDPKEAAMAIYSALGTKEDSL